MRAQQGKRLRQARLAAGYRSARSAALSNAWSESTYRAHENGTRTIGQDDAERYAEKFRAHDVDVNAADILFGAPMRTASTASSDNAGANPKTLKTLQTALLTIEDGEQSLTLPEEFQFSGEEVFIRRDPLTGDVILTQRRPEWDRFFTLLRETKMPEEFLSPEERDQGPQDRDPLEGVEG